MLFSRSPFIALAVSATIGSALELGHLAHGARGLVPVHLGHHDVHQDERDVGVRLQRLDALAAVLREHDLHAAALEDARQGEDVPHVVVHDQHLLALEHGVGHVQALEHLPLVRREPRLHPVQVERGLVEQPLRRAHVLHHDRLRVPLQARLVLRRQLAARVHDHRQVAEPLRAPQPVEQLEGRCRPRKPGRARGSRTRARRASRAPRRVSPRPRPRRPGPPIRSARPFRSRSSSATSSTERVRRSRKPVELREHVAEQLRRGLLRQAAERAGMP